MLKSSCLKKKESKKMGSLTMSKCKSCGQSVEWAEFASGKRSLFMPDANGAWAIEHGKARCYTDEDASLGRERYVSHFSNCPLCLHELACGRRG